MDFLNEFTKKEIIEWIRQDIHFRLRPPKKSELLFIRWQTRLKELEKKCEKSREMLAAIDGEIEPYDKQFRAWRDFEKTVMKEHEEVEKIYQSIDKARTEERLATAST